MALLSIHVDEIITEDFDENENVTDISMNKVSHMISPLEDCRKKRHLTKIVTEFIFSQ